MSDFESEALEITRMCDTIFILKFCGEITWRLIVC